MNRHVSWLARVAASAAVRRLVYLAIAGVIALVLSFVPTGKAHAQDQGHYPFRSAAISACQADMAEALAYSPSGSLSNNCSPDSPVVNGERAVACGGYLSVQGTPGTYGNRGCTASAGSTRGQSEPGRSLYFWPADAVEPDCAAKPAHGPVSFDDSTSSGVFCDGNCAYVVAQVGDPGANWRTVGGRTFSSGAKPSGETCTTGTPLGPYDPNQEVCKSTGGSHAECVKPNGDHCVVSASGANLCWKPKETGERMTTDGKTGADREIAPATPTPPSNQENPTQEGPTSTTTINGDTYNTSIFSGTGNTGGQGNTGTGGKDTGGTSKPGTGTGDGEGDGESDAPGQGVGDGLYTGSDKTVGSVFSTFKGRVEGSPLIGAATGFFAGCSGGGSCPNETWDGGDYAGQHDLSSLCSGPLASLLGYAGWICLAGMGAVGFRIALL